MIQDILIIMSIASHDNGHLIFLTETQHLKIILPGIETGTARIQRVVVKLQQCMIFLCRLYDSFHINRISSVIRMPDNVDMGILHGTDQTLGVILPAARLNTGLVKTGDCHIHISQMRLFQIHRSIFIQNIQFHAQQQLQIPMLSGNHFQIMKIKIGTGSFHARCMLCDSIYFQSLILCLMNHLHHGIVRMTTGDGMSMQV